MNSVAQPHDTPGASGAAVPAAVSPLPEWFRRARATGLLPPDAPWLAADTRPWPVVLLTALGAWLAAVPLLAVVSMLLGPLVIAGIGPWLVGALVIAGAAVVLNARGVPLFVEQLAVPGLLVGLGTLSFGAWRDLPSAAAALLLAAVAGVLAAAIARTWLRVLLGAAMAALVGYAVLRWVAPTDARFVSRLFWVSHALLLPGLAALAVCPPGLGRGAPAQVAAALEAIGSGWLLLLMAALSLQAGVTFLVAGALGGAGALAQDMSGFLAPRAVLNPRVALGLALGAVAVAALARAWPEVRRPPVLAASAVLAALAWLQPLAGALMLLAALAAVSGRRALAGAAALGWAWVIGAAYYALAWPLSTKAAVLAGAGAVLGALAWTWARSTSDAPLVGHGPNADATTERPAPRPSAPASRLGTAAVALGTVTTLAVAGVAIWQKERLIASGRPVFLELAPVDPRSLMQGDYMRLAFKLPAQARSASREAPGVPRLQVAGPVDDRGVARLERLVQPGQALAPGELRVELTARAGRWTVATDAWFFAEGDGQRWSRARYGEFRVDADGRALLVGLADADLRLIRADPP